MKILTTLLLLSLIVCTPIAGHAGDKRIVLIAGKPSHGPGEHEFRAGALLLQKCLAGFPGIQVEVYTNDWPTDSAVLQGAAAVVIFSDGGARHPATQTNRLALLNGLMKQGVGFACLHYACEPTIENGQNEFIDWMGGCFEINRSVNPTWVADFKTFPTHPVARGLKSFSMLDEWYFNMRFRDGMQGVQPILATVPPLSTMDRHDGPHSGNPGVRVAVEKGEPQTMAWVAERSDGGRGFGFTGGHYHRNWGNENFRKVVLNGILWVAKVEVPADGVNSTVTAADLEQNLDPKVRKQKLKGSVKPAAPASVTK